MSLMLRVGHQREIHLFLSARPGNIFVCVSEMFSLVA